MLSGQGSNLDSSEPKSDVLPITPPDRVAAEHKIRLNFRNGKQIANLGCAVYEK